MHKGKILIALPAYNEAANLPPLLERFCAVMEKHRQPYEIIIVNDGSTDNTGQVIRNWATRKPVTPIEHPVNLGLGATIRDALFAAAQRDTGNDLILTMDADNTHPPEILPEMVRTLETGADVVIASRFVPGATIQGLSLFRKWISRLASWTFRLILPIRGVKDYTCGYRLYKASKVREAFRHYGETGFVDQQGFQCMVDILLKLNRLGNCQFAESPLHLEYDKKAGDSKMKVWQTSWKTLQLIWRYKTSKTLTPSK
ncbi:MAG: glycosyltransferase family 2 protein [Bacteroidetes bacterium]|nr:glycosyltransferase family 2 protein [Bacteroidota bacterium]